MDEGDPHGERFVPRTALPTSSSMADTSTSAPSETRKKMGPKPTAPGKFANREGGRTPEKRKRRKRCLRASPRDVQAVCRLLLLVVMWCQLMREADSFGFKYADFNQTDGLLFLGDAITSSCEEKDGADAQSQLAYGYQPRHGKTSPASMLHLLTETVETIRDMRVETAREADADDMETNLAGIGHRDESFFGGFADLETDDCALRLRLTSSQPNETGAVWRDEGTNVLQGFSTKFNFQISDLSRACALVRDASFSSKRYESCSVHGGDGFAFVIHGDDGDRTALGQGGADLGFGGLQNALAIEFDVWYNAERGDAFEDHVTVLAAGPGETLLAREALHLSSPQPTALADGRIHSARIVYYPFLNTDLLPFFQITTTGTAYVVDNGEGYRLGTLGIFIDGNNTHPLVAIPINLSAFLDLEENRAIVGFTSATGRSWASHDILSWTFCESHDDADCA